MCYVENKLSAPPPKMKVRKKAQASLPSSVPKYCHSKTSPGRAGWRGREGMEKPADLRASSLTSPAWLVPCLTTLKGRSQLACALPGRCRGRGCGCKVRTNHSAGRRPRQTGGGGRGFMPALLGQAPLHDPVGSDNFEIFSKSTKFNSNE